MTILSAQPIPALGEYAILNRRRLSILEIFDQEPLTQAQANEYILELAEIETALQKYDGTMSDIGDAKLCAKFGTSL